MDGRSAEVLRPELRKRMAKAITGNDFQLRYTRYRRGDAPVGFLSAILASANEPMTVVSVGRAEETSRAFADDACARKVKEVKWTRKGARKQVMTGVVGEGSVRAGWGSSSLEYDVKTRKTKAGMCMIVNIE